MPLTVMLTLGRLPKALDLARSFAAAGHRVLIAEPHGWHLSRLSRCVHRCVRVIAPGTHPEAYLDGLLDIIHRESVDVVVPVSEEILHVAGLAHRLPRAVRLLCPPREQLLTLHHKGRFIQRAAAHGLDVPVTRDLHDPGAAPLAASGRYVVKPALSCAGHGVRVLEPGTPLPAAGSGPETIVQAFVEGALRSSFTIAHEGRVLVSVVYRGTVMSGTVAVCFERVDDAPDVQHWIQRFVEAESFSGFIGFDFVVEPSGRVLAIECNPRATSGIHFIRQEDLATAVLEPATAPPPRLRDDRLLQQFWPCLTETQAAMFRRGGFRHRLSQLWQARDVTWSRRDPLPLLLMPFGSYPILARSIFAGLSFGEAATLDIAWSGTDQVPP